jgi:transposase
MPARTPAMDGGCRVKGGVVRPGREPLGMGARFIGVDREQVFLMPPSVRDWVPEGHLVWTVLDAVGELDLSAFYGAYRADGHGCPAYEPSMMVALLMYAYARGNRSARGIERACVEDVAYRVVAGNLVADRSTIAEFRRRHEHALGAVFSGVLGLCAQVGLASVGVVSIDGTKMSANASMHANRDFGQIARAVLREAAEIDQREDELYGSDRGDELPEQLRTREGRRQALREAKERRRRERDAAVDANDDQDDDRVEIELDLQQFVTRPQGRRAWLREGRRALEGQREREGRPIAGDRAERLFEACRRLEQELDADRAANAAYEQWRAHGVAADGSRRMAPGMVKPFELPQGAGGADQCHRPGLACGAHAGSAGDAGLQRPARRQRPPDHRRRRDHDRVTGLRAPRTDGPCHPARTRRARRR